MKCNLAYSYWNEQRTHLNHDVLMNQLLVEVVALQRNPKLDPSRLLQWKSRSVELRAFIAGSKECLSYAVLLQSFPDSQWSPSLRSQVEQMFDLLFVSETPIRRLTHDAMEVLDILDQYAEAYLSLEQEEEKRDCLQMLEASVRNLSSIMSKLPQCWFANGGTSCAPIQQ